MDRIEEFIVEYIQREYTIPNDVNLSELNFVESGYIDSIGLIQFIATLEDEFNISFTDEELESEDVKVVGKLVELIKRKM